MSKLQTSGKIHMIGQTQQVSDTFKKREFVLAIESGAYTEYVKFEVIQDKVSIIDNFKQGDEVTVFFNLRGREWQGKYFVNLHAWRVNKYQEETPEAPAKNGSADLAPKYGPPSEGDDLPF